MDNLPIQTIQTPGVEDLRPGDYVTVSRVTVELPPFVCPPIPGGDGRFSYIPMDAGDPRKVLAVCVPFLLVAMPDGKHETLDVRRHRGGSAAGGLRPSLVQAVPQGCAVGARRFGNGSKEGLIGVVVGMLSACPRSRF